MVQSRVSRSSAAIRTFESSEAPATLRSVKVRPATSMANASPRVEIAAGQVLADRLDPGLCLLTVVARGVDAAADVVLVVDMGGALPLQAGDLVLEAGLLHQPAVAGGDRLGHGELVGLAADVLDARGRCGRRTGRRR